MESLNEDLNDSALICMPLIQKRKACGNLNHKNFKQAKLSYPRTLKGKGNINDSLELFDEIKDNRDSEKQSKIHTFNSNLDESSSYFQDKKSVNTCPLCLKTFEKDSGYMVHMKQCAKKQKITTQQLLKALELQKKQLQERRMLGLCSQILPAKKKVTKKVDADEETQAQYDLGLALALSKSLESDKNEPKPVTPINGISNVILEEHEFSSSSGAGPSKKRTKINKKSILKERTSEERQRIITEKAAIVLLDEDKCSHLETSIVENDFSLKSIQLTKFQNKASHLWNLGENEGKLNWYVENIKKMFIMKEEGDEKFPNDAHFTETSISKFNMVNEISKLNLPRGNIYQDWKKMINNDKFSDFIVKTKDDHNFYLHSLILFVRCPEVLENNLKSIFENFNLSTLLIFSEYLYCGTLNQVSVVEIEPLLSLANHCNYKDLINVLNCLQIVMRESNNEIIPSSVTPDEKKDSKLLEAEIAIIDEKEELTIVPDKENFFVEDIVDLTQSSPGSSTVNDDNDTKYNSEDETNSEKSYWSFLNHEKEREKMRKQEEEKENTEIRNEMEKIETSQKQQHEMMQRHLNEYETEETSLNNKLELEKIYGLDTREESNTKDFEEELQIKSISQEDDCIIILSDSETLMSNAEEITTQGDKPLGETDFEAPFYDPYDHFDQFSPVEYNKNIHSQSFLTGDVSFGQEKVQQDKMERRTSPEYCSTPVSNRRTSRIDSSVKKFLNTSKKRNNLSASRIIRKSLGLRNKKFSKKESAKKAKKRNLKGRKKTVETITNSILNEFSNSSLFKTSTPQYVDKLIEMTPGEGTDIEFGETVTPSPNYGHMRGSVIKEQLSKYGLKRSLGKNKAKRILQYIYEELHPYINTETGKLVKMPPTNTPKSQKKTTKITGGGKEGKTKLVLKNKKKLKTSPKTVNCSNNSKSSEQNSNSYESLDRLTDYDSDKNEFEDLNEPLTQTSMSNPADLQSAFNELLLKNPNFHQKILLYEPIWLEDLQKELKKTFEKHFKLSDLMDYLDQKCITFRSLAQKKNNQKRNENTKTNVKKRKNFST